MKGAVDFTGKVTFTDNPTEQTTAVTNLILALMAVVAALYVYQIGWHQPFKAYLWIGAFGLLAIAAILGALAHGIEPSEKSKKLIWHGLYLGLGLLVALFVVAAVYDIRGMVVAIWVLPAMVGIGLLFFCTTLIWPGTFMGFIFYETAAMSIALVGYLGLAITGRLTGSWLMSVGIFVTLVAAAIQASRSVSFKLIWQFDHNGAYHLLQMVGVGLIVAGLRAAFM